MVMGMHQSLKAQTLTIGSGANCAFDTVVVPVTINNPTLIGAMSLAINFDPMKLQYAGLHGIHPNLTATGFHTFNQINHQIKFTWFSTTGGSTTVQDTLFWVQFIGQQSGNFPLEWDTTVVENNELIDTSGAPITVNLQNGSANVLAAPVNATLFTVDTLICPNEQVIFLANSSSGNMYEFYINNNLVQAASTSNTMTVDTFTQNAVVHAIAYNASGCAVGTNTISIVVNPVPIGFMTGDTSICPNGTGVFYFSFGTSDIYNVTVTDENGGALNVNGIFNGLSHVISVANTTKFYLTEVVNTATGCKSNGQLDSVTIAVLALPIVDLGNDTTICSDETVTLDAGTSGTVYIWSNGVSAQTTIVNTSGDYSVTVTDVNGCQNQDTINVLVNCFSLSGDLTYANSASTPMSNVDLTLVDAAGNTVTLPASSSGNPVTTNASGQYSFTKVPIGTYTIQANITKPWGGVDTTDAHLIIQAFAQTTTLGAFEYQAADVTADGAVNSFDALTVFQRYIGIIGFFPSGDWLTEKNPINIGTMDVIFNFRALCFGDVNGSHVP